MTFFNQYQWSSEVQHLIPFFPILLFYIFTYFAFNKKPTAINISSVLKCMPFFKIVLRKLFRVWRPQTAIIRLLNNKPLIGYNRSINGYGEPCAVKDTSRRVFSDDRTAIFETAFQQHFKNESTLIVMIEILV